MAWRPFTSQKVKTWDAKLRKRAITADIFSDLTGVYSYKTKSAPVNAIIAKVAPEKKGSNEHTISLRENLNEAGVFGRESQVGREEDFDTKFLKIFSNSFSHAVPMEHYGVDAYEASAYNPLQETQPLLSLWHKEKRGLHIRQALNERYSEQLLVSPLSKTAEINSNTWVCGVDPFSQATYDSTLSDYTDAISTVLLNAPSTTKEDNQLRSLSYLSELSWFASSQKVIKPVMVGGKECYITIVPSYQMQLLLNPANSAGLAGFAKDADTRGHDNIVFSQKVIPFGNLLLVADDRAPTLSCTDNGGTGSTITFGYKGPGLTDGRAARGTGAVSAGQYTEATHVWECGWLCGASALFDYETEPLHWREEVQDYEKISGLGAFKTNGIQLQEYDVESPDDSSRLNQTSIMLLFKA